MDNGDAVEKTRFKSLGTRAVSGFAMLLISGIPLYLGGYWFLCLVLVLAAMMIYEWVRMCDTETGITNYIIGGLGMICVLPTVFFGEWTLALWLLLATVLLVLVRNLKHPYRFLLSAGTGYILVGCLAALWIRTSSENGLEELIFICVTVVMADTFAYLGGSLIKGPKMAPKISPNKTWAGFFCGVFSAAIVCGALGVAYGLEYQQGALLGTGIAVASVIGDVLESAAKRHLDVKDSGTVLPGHGGILDRVDSLIFALTVSALVLYFYPQIGALFGGG